MRFYSSQCPDGDQTCLGVALQFGLTAVPKPFRQVKISNFVAFQCAVRPICASLRSVSYHLKPRLALQVTAFPYYIAFYLS